jgi:hypothetical protein
MNQPLSTLNVMDKHSTFAAATVSKSFSPRLLAQSTRENLLAVVVKLEAEKVKNNENVRMDMEGMQKMMENVKSMCPMMGKMMSSDGSKAEESKESATVEKAEHESHHPGKK